MIRNNTDKEIKYSIALLCVPLLFLFGIYFYSTFNNSDEINETSKVAAISESIKKVEYIPNPFENVNIRAKSAIVTDLNTGEIIYTKDANAPRPLASITKVMTALVAYELAKDKDESVYITYDALMTEGESFLSLGEKFNFRELIDFMLISSSNDAATAISQLTQKNNPEINFISQMNITASKIGMKDTYFLNETGLDKDLTNAGAFGSASDINILMSYVLKNYPEIFESTKDVKYQDYSESGILHDIGNTNSAIPRLKNIIASKTGYTDIAGGNLAVIVDPGLNRPVSIVVLGSTAAGRFDDVLKLSNSLEQYFNYELLNK